MAYIKTTWVDHVEDPITGEVFTQGTPVDSSHLNKMEDGIASAHDAANMALRLYTTATEPDSPGPYIWVQPVDSDVGLLALGTSAREGLNVTMDNQTLAVTNAEAGTDSEDNLSYTIR